jgi:hypothetical protein
VTLVILNPFSVLYMCVNLIPGHAHYEHLVWPYNRVWHWAPSPKVGRANYTTVTEIPASEEVLSGMFYLFEHPIIILFTSRVSHDFMSLACARKAKFSLWATKVSYLIITPGGRVVVDRMVHKIKLEFVGRVFPTILIILEGQVINVILGMNWMKMHKALWDISTCLVQLDSPIFGKVALQLPPIAHLQASVHVIVARSLEEIHVIRNIHTCFLMIC